MKRIWGVVALLLLLPACAVVRLPLGPSDEVREATLAGEGDDKVLLLDVSGMLSFQRPWALPGWPERDSLPERVRADLDRARRDPAVKALLVRIDSPGGTVTASDVLYHEIRSFGTDRGVPVVAAILEKGLSGGYYVALAADEVVAHPTSLVGSVGVFVGKFDASELLDRWGIRSELTKSGPQKDLLSPLRPATPAERETLAAIVDELYGRFEELLKTSRPRVSEDDLAAIATAAPFTARRAAELHLVDRLGYLDDAFRVAVERAGLDRARLVAYRRPGAGPANPYSLAALANGLDPLLLDPRWLREVLEGGAYY